MKRLERKLREIYSPELAKLIVGREKAAKGIQRQRKRQARKDRRSYRRDVPFLAREYMASRRAGFDIPEVDFKKTYDFFSREHVAEILKTAEGRGVDAQEYVDLIIESSGHIPRPADMDRVCGVSSLIMPSAGGEYSWEDFDAFFKNLMSASRSRYGWGNGVNPDGRHIKARVRLTTIPPFCYEEFQDGRHSKGLEMACHFLESLIRKGRVERALELSERFKEGTGQLSSLVRMSWVYAHVPDHMVDTLLDKYSNSKADGLSLDNADSRFYDFVIDEEMVETIAQYKDLSEGGFSKMADVIFDMVVYDVCSYDDLQDLLSNPNMKQLIYCADSENHLDELFQIVLNLYNTRQF